MYSEELEGNMSVLFDAFSLHCEATLSASIALAMPSCPGFSLHQKRSARTGGLKGGALEGVADEGAVDLDEGLTGGQHTHGLAAALAHIRYQLARAAGQAHQPLEHHVVRRQRPRLIKAAHRHLRASTAAECLGVVA